MIDDDPRWGDPRDRDNDVREIEVHWIEFGRVLPPIGRPKIRATARKTYANETGIHATATRAVCFSTAWNCRADSNARSSWTAIIGTS